MRHVLILVPLMHFGCKDPLVVKEYLTLVSVSPGQGATQVAIDTQATFGYVQNTVVRALTDDAPVLAAIVA